MATNGQNAMLPLQLLLNPDSPSAAAAPPRQWDKSKSNIGLDLASPSTSIVFSSKMKRAKEPSGLSKPGPRGPVNFPPYEDLSHASLQEVTKFNVTPFGQIHQGFEHFPYNSEKRDLLDKTGRESIEAFMYDFRVPGSNSVHVVMWDYNIGIVRLATLFRLCGFNKTGPAQTFSKNPGLLDITPNVTGGAVPAQGYWFPYYCARAICAKFCHQIAGALIPLFGPDFPEDCTPPESPRYRRLDISHHIVVEATRECERYRRIYMSQNAKDTSTTIGYPRPETVSFLRSSFQGRQLQNPVTRFVEHQGVLNSVDPQRQQYSQHQKEKHYGKYLSPAGSSIIERRGLRQAYRIETAPYHTDRLYQTQSADRFKRRRVEELEGELIRPSIETGDAPKQEKREDTEQFSAAMILVSIRDGVGADISEPRTA